MAQRVRMRFGASEIEVEGESKFIRENLEIFFARLSSGFPDITTDTDLPARIVKAATPSKELSPAEYYREKSPKGGTEKLVVLGRYLEFYRGLSDFTRAEINKLAKEAKVKDLHAQYVTLAMKQGLIRSTGRGRYALTLTGEDAVLALPKSPKQGK